MNTMIVNLLFHVIVIFRLCLVLTHFVSYNLCMGFIFSQVILLSATMPQEVLEVTSKFMRDPVRILVKKEELTLEGIRQFYINVEKEVSGEFRVEKGIFVSQSCPNCCCAVLLLKL